MLVTGLFSHRVRQHQRQLHYSSQYETGVRIEMERRRLLHLLRLVSSLFGFDAVARDDVRLVDLECPSIPFVGQRFRIHDNR